MELNSVLLVFNVNNSFKINFFLFVLATWILYEMCKNQFKLNPSFILVSTIATNSHLPLVPEKVTKFSTSGKVIYEHIKSNLQTENSNVNGYRKLPAQGHVLL